MSDLRTFLFLVLFSCILTANAQTPVHEKYAELDSGYQLYYRGNYNKAGEVVFSALRKAEKSQNLEQQAEAYRMLGEINRASNNKIYALKYLDRAEKIFSELGHDYGVASTKNRKAAVYFELKDSNAFETYLNSSLKISRDNGFKDIEFNNLTILGSHHYWNKLDYVSSFRILKEAAAIAHEIEAYEDLPYVYLNLATSYRLLGEFDSSLRYLRISLEYSKRYQVMSYIARSYGALSLIYGESFNNYQKAWEYERLYTIYSDTIYKVSRKKEIAELIETYKADVQQAEIERKDSLIQAAILAFGVLAVLLVILFLLYVRLKKKQRELAASEQSLKALNGMKDRLLSVLSHDLRSPLATLQNVFELLDFNELSKEELENIFTQMQANVYQTGQLLDNLLVWIKSQVNAIEPVQETIRPYQLLQENVELLRPLAEEKNIQLQLDGDDSFSTESDKEMVKLIIRNILNNAIKFTRNGGVVRLKGDSTSSGYLVIISDEGVGIKQDKLEQLFDLGSISSKGTNEEVGMGIGLTLVKEFADLLEINVEVDSVVDKGTTFQLYFT